MGRERERKTSDKAKLEKRKKNEKGNRFQKNGTPLFRPLEWFYSASEADPDWVFQHDLQKGMFCLG